MALESMDLTALETRTQAIGRQLFERAKCRHEQLTTLNRWTKEVLSWCLSDPKVSTQVLRFIDCLPSLTSPSAIARHVHDYFPSDALRLPAPLRMGAALSTKGLLTASAVSLVVRQLTEQVGRQFIAGTTPHEAMEAMRRLAAQGMMISFDLLGEQVLSEAEADAYAKGYTTLLHAFSGANQRGLHISVKPSGLSPRFDPLDALGSVDGALRRLSPILALASSIGAGVTLDMEQYERRDLTLELLRAVWKEPSTSSLQVGVVMQAYLRDAETVTAELLASCAREKRRVAVRLVKGAYWDHEVAHATQRNWPVPVYQQKGETDQAFERLTRQLLAAPAQVRTEIASHNLRSIAHAMAVAEAVGVAKDQVEFQVLYGMGDAVAGAVRQMGYSVRVYTPIGELIPGMAYLVRRLLENTANESFLRHDLVHDRSAEELLTAPTASEPIDSCVREGEWRNESPLDFSKSTERDRVTEALSVVRTQLGAHYPVLLGDGDIEAADAILSRNPASPAELIGKVSQASLPEVNRAVRLATAAQPAWAKRPVAERAACLCRAAELMRARRHELIGWEIFEVGKTWREADADLWEAIDFLTYYSAQMQRVAGESRLRQVPGERTTLRYVPRGVAVVIAPWNFPIGILTGMTSAALITGHAVIVKPAEQSSVLACHVAQMLREAGVPPSVVQLLPGLGTEVGAALVRHTGTHAVLFTGSKAVGLGIVKAAAHVPQGQQFVKQVVAEMGGKNAIIIDDDADLDAAVAGTLASAFGYGGQKCSAASRVIVHRGVYDRFVARLVAATDRLLVGDPTDPAVDIGPLIDENAQRRLLDAISHAREVAHVAYTMPASRLPSRGYFVPPTIVTEVPRRHALAHEELFGPLVCVFRAENFEEELEIANDCDYGLTGGVYSRLPSHLDRAADAFAVGNLYFNRPITGAIVGRQPFGGYKLSGLGTKAGGPDYLLSLVVPKTICENRTRHGMPLDNE